MASAFRCSLFLKKASDFCDEEEKMTWNVVTLARLDFAKMNYS